MRKILLSFTALTTASIMLAACQSKSYKVKGEADMLQDGDTLFLTTDFFTGTPIDTIIVENGKFTIEGTADSTCFCMLYSSKQVTVNIPFFIEPGNINLRISDNPLDRRASGTSTNNKWQELNDSSMNIARQVNMIAAYIENNNLSDEEQKEQMLEYKKLFRQFQNLVIDYARKNTDNEFGYFLLTYYDTMSDTDMHYKDGIIDVDTKLELINKLPREMQKRQALKAVVKHLNQMKAFAEGGKIEDFEMNDINGKPLSIMQEIRKNRITVIDFWASWCGPCIGEMPNMVKMYKQYKDKGLGIFGISLDSRQEDWENATKRLGIEWPQVSDLQGWNNAAAKMFNIQSIPQTIVVNSEGIILKKELRGAELEAFVESQLKE